MSIPGIKLLLNGEYPTESLCGVRTFIIGVDLFITILLVFAKLEILL